MPPNDRNPKKKEEELLTHDELIAREAKQYEGKPPLQVTNYGGAEITKGQAAQLRAQPAAELLNFTELGDKPGDKVVLQAKMPEMGYAEGIGTFKIRENMNHFARGMVNAVMDKNGILNTKKVQELDDLRDNLFQAERGSEEYNNLKKKFIDKLDVPKGADREDFGRFLDADEDGFLLKGGVSPISHMASEIGKLALRQHLEKEGGTLTERNAWQKKEVDPDTLNKTLAASQEDFDNISETYQLMAGMNPKEEKRILYPTDCIAFRALMDTFVTQNNAYRKENHLPELDAISQLYVFNADQPGYPMQEEDREKNKCRFFDQHHLMAVPVKLGKENVVLSLENTAPPAGKLAERPHVERTGVGIFPNVDALHQFHYKVNVGYIDNETESLAYDTNTRKFSEQSYSVNMKVDTWGRSALHEREAARNAPDKEGVEKHFLGYMLSQSVQEAQKQWEKRGKKPDEKEPPPYSAKTLESNVQKQQKDPEFRAIVKVYGADGMRKALREQDPMTAAIKLCHPDKEKCYALGKAGKEQLRALGQSMETKGRSQEWLNLKNALSDPNMTNSSQIMDAVEKYTKGKKSVRKTEKGRDSFDLAMKALAVAAENGDAVAKARAQNLVDRINDVRGVKSGQPNFVNLEAYGPANPERQKTQKKTIQKNEAQVAPQ